MLVLAGLTGTGSFASRDNVSFPCYGRSEWLGCWLFDGPFAPELELVDELI